jgi:hypothetical protein
MLALVNQVLQHKQLMARGTVATEPSLSVRPEIVRLKVLIKASLQKQSVQPGQGLPNSNRAIVSGIEHGATFVHGGDEAPTPFSRYNTRVEDCIDESGEDVQKHKL